MDCLPLLGQDHAAELGPVRTENAEPDSHWYGLVRAPRMVLSTAMTVLSFFLRWCRCACRTMTPGGHRGLRGLGPGASAGSWIPTSGPAPLEGPDVGVHRSDEARTVMCSYIAVRLRQPASTPAMFRDRIVKQVMAHYASVPGAVTFLRTWVRGWRDRTAMVEDDVVAGSSGRGID